MTSRQLAIGFAGWLSSVEHARLCAARSEQLLTALKHMTNLELSRAWSTWHVTSATLVRNKAVLRRGLGHLLTRELSLGFGAWAEMAAERSALKQAMLKGVAAGIAVAGILGGILWYNLPRSN
jgi:hypothetical protein